MHTQSANDRAGVLDGPRRWYAYIAIALALVVAITIWAFEDPHKFNHAYDPWVQFGILTLVIFGYLMKWFWRYRSSVNFWLLYAFLLTAHCAVFLRIVSRSGRWPVLTLGFVGSIEGMMLFALIAALRERFRVHHRRGEQ